MNPSLGLSPSGRSQDESFTLTVMLLKIKNLKKSFPIESKLLHQVIGKVIAVDNVSLGLDKGEVLGLVGESSSGKTTLGKIIAGLVSPDSGEIFFQEKNIQEFTRKERAKKIQIIFQDPFASLNPRLSVGTILAEATRIRHEATGTRYQAREIEEEIKELLNIVGMPTNILHNYPHQFSGGQRQRIGIARALARQPELIIADEPVSSLDISIQAQILNLLVDLKEKFGLSYLFIAHDLSVVNFIADRTMVMYQGRIVEEGETEEILREPKNIYTQKLLNSLPLINFTK